MQFTQKNWANISVLSTFSLMLIWVLPNTIALRHFLLAIGVISGVFLIKENWSSLKSLKLQLIPLYSILGLFLWVGVHYYFFSLNPILELSEIKGLWLRTVSGSVMAIGLGIALYQHNDLRKYFYIGVFSVPTINISAYLYDSYLHGGFIAPNDFIFFLFAKIETAYFGGIAAAVSVGSIVYLIRDSRNSKKVQQIILYSLGLALVFIANIVSNTKNGILIAMLMTCLLIAIIFFHVLTNIRDSKIKLVGISALITICLVICLMFHIHDRFANGSWSSVYQDALVAIDIDKNHQWQFKEGTRDAPKNAIGVPAALNIYLRVAWATVGVRLISQYPLGYGSINQSFEGLQTLSGIYHENHNQAHSGWVDFGLAFGLPGYFFIFITIFSIIRLAINSQNQMTLVAMMIALMLIPFCLTSEMSYKQYFESMIFFLTLSGAIVALYSNKKSKER
jgi:hypothetical protein